MARICQELPGWKMANLVEGGETPMLPPARLEALGFSIAAYPLTLLSAAMNALQQTLQAMKSGQQHPDGLLDFSTLREIVGFDDYYDEERRYGGAREGEI